MAFCMVLRITLLLQTTDYMHYSSCDCFLGHGKQQLCYEYNKKKGIGYGTIGVVLGICSAVLVYIIIECLLNKQGPCFHDNLDDQLYNSEEKEEKQEVAEMEDPPVDDTSQRKEQLATHRHRKCWACDIKKMQNPPPPWMIYKK